ncbi:MAG TPA: hypothetical protein VNO32_23965 [Candidatus Acidoferrum sp.]|nr:hypothetical protein [Candidatus Acidoferrum sp.]
MPKIIEQWLLSKYIEGQFTPLSKPFKTKEQAEKARLKLPERERGAIGVTVTAAGQSTKANRNGKNGRFAPSVLFPPEWNSSAGTSSRSLWNNPRDAQSI